MEVVLTDQFLDRVEEYSDHIVLDDILAAVKWARGVFSYCKQLKKNSESGRIVPEFACTEI